MRKKLYSSINVTSVKEKLKKTQSSYTFLLYKIKIVLTSFLGFVLGDLLNSYSILAYLT